MPAATVLVDRLSHWRELLEGIDNAVTDVIAMPGETTLHELELAIDELRDALFDAHLEALKEERDHAARTEPGRGGCSPHDAQDAARREG